MAKACSVTGCVRRYYAKGYCEPHYKNLRKHGSIEPPPRAIRNPADRFWARVDRSRPEECWTWPGSRTKAGYGRFQIGRKGSPHWMAHRFAFHDTYGFLPTVVMHTCDNPCCVNPAHLVAGDYKANTQDMIAKGRNASGGALGDRNFNTKLTPDDVRQIRAMQGQSAGGVGRKFGVGHKAILAIWRGLTWRHIE